MIEINMIAGMGHGTPLGNGLALRGLTCSMSASPPHARSRSSGGSRPRRKAPPGNRGRKSPPANGHPRVTGASYGNAKTNPRQSAAIHQFPRHPELGQPGVKKIIEDALRQRA